MNTRYISGMLFSCLLFLGITTTASANEENRTAIAVSENTAIYAITYTFTTEDYDLSLPIITDRSLETDADSRTTNYTFSTSADGDTAAGTATGLVLSDAAIVDGQYFVPQGTTANFTLFVVLTLDENDPRAKYGLQMTNLPFTVHKDDTSSNQNITTLSAYKTKEVGLN